MKRVNLFICLLVLVSISVLMLVNGCGSAAPSSGGGGGASATPWVYVGNDHTNSIYYMGLDSTVISGTIELGCYSPYHFAASPDGKKLYVSTAASNEIVIVDTGSNQVTGLITLDTISGSYGMKVSPDGKYLYKGMFSFGSFYKIDLTNGTYTNESVAGIVHGIAISPDGTKIYGCCRPMGGEIYSISPDYPFSSTLVTSVNDCWDMAVKDGRVYAPIQSGVTNECLIINISTGTFEAIFGEGNNYWGAVAIPGKNEVYVSSRNDPGDVYVINTLVPTFEAAKVTNVSGLANPEYMAVSADGRYVAVLDTMLTHGKIGFINTATRSLEAYVTIPSNGGLIFNNIAIIYK